jgi:hypothetical protein
LVKPLSGINANLIKSMNLKLSKEKPAWAGVI